MPNILISRTDPHSFMGLIKASPISRRASAAHSGLINAGVISILLFLAISRMAQTAQDEARFDNPLALGADTALTTTCRLTACKMV